MVQSRITYEMPFCPHFIGPNEVFVKTLCNCKVYKEQLCEILERKQINVVRGMLRQWTNNVMRSKVEAMKEVTAMIHRHIDGIVA